MLNSERVYDKLHVSSFSFLIFPFFYSFLCSFMIVVSVMWLYVLFFFLFFFLSVCLSCRFCQVSVVVMFSSLISLCWVVFCSLRP